MACNHWFFSVKVYSVTPNTNNSYDCKYIEFVFLILLMDGDIESNQKPEIKTKNPVFFMFGWNVFSLSSHNKLSI